MKVEKKDGSIEREILIGMISNDAVVSRIAAKWEDGLFESRQCEIIARWCVEHCRKYGTAPRTNIRGIYESWINDEQVVAVGEAELVEQILIELSDCFEPNLDNSAYLIDLASSYFNRVRVAKLITSLQGNLDRGRLEKAIQHVQSFRRVEMGASAAIDVYGEKEAINSTFVQDESCVLIRWSGALGEFFGSVFERDGFVAFTAPQKTGKSFWLLEVAHQAIRQRRKVAYFQVGDMSERQVKLRMYSRIAEWPYRSTAKTGSLWPCDVSFPISIKCELEGEESYAVGAVRYKTLTFSKPLNFPIVWRACQKLRKKVVKSEEENLRLVCFPVRGTSVIGIKDRLEEWDTEGWHPDVVVIDYADNLEPCGLKMDPRDQINDTWERLRALSQVRHCLIVTATQANAREGYTKRTLDRSCFSGDNRKLNHVTAMYGINVFGVEKSRGICRINAFALREDDFDPFRCVHVAGCLALANPAVVSCFE